MAKTVPTTKWRFQRGERCGTFSPFRIFEIPSHIYKKPGQRARMGSIYMKYNQKSAQADELPAMFSGTYKRIIKGCSGRAALESGMRSYRVMISVCYLIATGNRIVIIFGTMRRTPIPGAIKHPTREQRIACPPTWGLGTVDVLNVAREIVQAFPFRGGDVIRENNPADHNQKRYYKNRRKGTNPFHRFPPSWTEVPTSDRNLFSFSSMCIRM